MRITGGRHRSRKLETPKNDAVRPTSDKVRQAIFNMLNARGVVRNSNVIDAFCGTGALGLEALSQGAAQSLFFDINKNSIQLVKSNIAHLKEEERSIVFLQNAANLKLRDEAYPKANLVFLDPPYHKNLVPLSIQSLYENDWLDQDCTFVIETAKDEIIASDLIEIQNEKIYGDTKIVLANLKSV